MKRERDPTPEEFEKLLVWLDSDREEAGRKLALIQTRLIRVFAARGCCDAETLADEVSNRVAVRVDTVTKKYPDPLRCCLGFVDNVHKEYLKEQHKISIARQPAAARPPDELEKEDQCLSCCLESLEKLEREFLERYFQAEKRVRIIARQKLAAELKLTANALRIRAHYLRKELQQCIVGCLTET